MKIPIIDHRNESEEVTTCTAVTFHIKTKTILWFWSDNMDQYRQFLQMKGNEEINDIIEYCKLHQIRAYAQSRSLMGWIINKKFRRNGVLMTKTEIEMIESNIVYTIMIG